eukprot:GAHX01001200.1.p1 GENE.GAHX01001200.1~~GAHX01001200.1.p1  ORF type:complete len:414 (-),score=61.62 GAHX01001200.1:1160-2401(-)
MPLKPISLKGNWQQKRLTNKYVKPYTKQYDSIGTISQEDCNITDIQAPFLSPIKKVTESTKLGLMEPSMKFSSFKLTQTPSINIGRKILNPVNLNITSSLKRTKKIEKTNIEILKNNQTIKLNSNEYKIIEKIGCGGYSNVYKGVLTQQYSAINSSAANLPLVAIKTRIIFGKRKEKTYKEIENEILLLMQYRKDPHVIQIVEHGKIFNLKLHDSTLAIDIHVIVLEYATTDLSSIIKSYPKSVLPPSTCLYFFQQMVEAVETIHSENIVHGDIKPANFVLCKDKLKLIDFATSRKMDGDFSFHTSTELVCTPCYVAPEVVSSHKNKKYFVRLANDIWGLGCILYEMVSGIRMHNGLNNGKAIISCLKSGMIKIDYNAISNKEICRIIKRCFEIDEHKRIAIAELKMEIEQLL